MTVTQFLTTYARGSYRTLDELYPIAVSDGLLRKGEGRREFVALLSSWMSKYPDGHMSNGLVYYTELPFGRQTSARTRSGDSVAAIMVSSH